MFSKKNYFIIQLLVCGMFSFLIVSNSYAQKSNEEVLKKGIQHLQDGMYDEAYAEFNQAIEIDPESRDAYYNRGVLYLRQENSDQAIFDFNKVIAMNPLDCDAFFSRGLAYSMKENYEQAIDDFTRIISMTPHNAEAAYNARAMAYAQKGDFEQAISDYSQIITMQPDYAEAYYDRAVNYSAQGKFDLAREDLHKAESLGFDTSFDQELINKLRTIPEKDIPHNKT